MIYIGMGGDDGGENYNVYCYFICLLEKLQDVISKRDKLEKKINVLGIRIIEFFLVCFFF